MRGAKHARERARKYKVIYHKEKTGELDRKAKEQKRTRNDIARKIPEE
jgi:hypothetical protein